MKLLASWVASMLLASLLTRLTTGFGIFAVLASLAFVISLVAMWMAGNAAKTVNNAIDKQTGRIKPTALDIDGD